MELDYYQNQAENSRLPSADTEYLLLGLIGEVGVLLMLMTMSFLITL